MAVIPGLWRLLFGNGRNVVAETVGIFQENAESGAARDATVKGQAMSQFAAEFAQPRKGLFDRAIDGLNRLPRPLLAFGTIGLFVMAMVDPIWFASRMQGIALVPEPLWWLMGAIVSFYFGARAQAKSQDFQQSVADTAARAGQVARSIKAIEALNQGSGLVIDAQDFASHPADDNPALADWRATRDRG